MTIKDITNDAKSRMAKSADAYQRDMTALRAGRANPQLLDRITIDYYGTATPVNQMGSVSSPEARMLVISPWDGKVLNDIVKAIQKSDLGINPTTDGKVIRLIFPELSEERRKDLTKVAKKSCEDAKVSVRNIRRDAIEQVKKLKKNSEITEDDQRKAEEDLQKLTDKAIKDVEAICAAKEKEIMSV